MAKRRGVIAMSEVGNTKSAKGTAYNKFEQHFMKVFVLNKTKFIEEMVEMSDHVEFTDDYNALRNNLACLTEPYSLEKVPEYFLENKGLLDEFAQFLVEDTAVTAWNTAKGYLSHLKLYFEDKFPAQKESIKTQYTAVTKAMRKQFTAQSAAAGKPTTTHHVPTTAADNKYICRTLLEMGKDDSCAAQALQKKDHYHFNRLTLPEFIQLQRLVAGRKRLLLRPCVGIRICMRLPSFLRESRSRFRGRRHVYSKRCFLIPALGLLLASEFHRTFLRRR
jgi:hypothetical protein